MLTRIKDLATKLAPRLIEIRRHIHSHPELSGQEYQTAAYVAGVLSSHDVRVQEAVGKTGVVGEVNGIGRDCRIEKVCVFSCCVPACQDRDSLHQS